MARLRSLGLHRPSALQYLINEGLLEDNSDSSRYDWSQNTRQTSPSVSVTDEILRTEECVVWSRNGTIKRVFNLDIENETIVHAFATSFPGTEVGKHGITDGEKSSDALIVILKTQVHIFMLSGDTHVLPLPFDVLTAYPTPRGFIIQQKRLMSQSRTQNQWSTDGIGMNPIPKPSEDLVLPSAKTNAFDRMTSENSSGPSTFSVVDPLSDIGVVVASASRKVRDVGQCQALSGQEQIIYVSKATEICEQENIDLEPVYLAVTLNAAQNNITIWQVHFSADLKYASSQSSSGEDKDLNRKKRQSSNVYERQSNRAASGHVLLSSRDSLGGLMQSFIDNNTKPQEPQLSKLEDLAAELGHDFEPKGVQTRSARRISSMIARTDLGANIDRQTFVEQSLGPASRKSMSRAARQEGSFGSFTERHSFGPNRTSAFAVPPSATSDGHSFLNAPTRLSIGDGNKFSADYGSTDSTENLHWSRDVVFAKLRTMQLQRQPSNPQPMVMTMSSPANFSVDEMSFRVSVCIFEREIEQLSVVNLLVRTDNVGSYNFERPKKHKVYVKAVEIQQGQNISDVCIVSSASQARIMTIIRPSGDLTAIQLEAPGATTFRLTLPPYYLDLHLWLAPRFGTQKAIGELGKQRAVAWNTNYLRFITWQNRGTLVMADSFGERHKLSIKLHPRDDFVRRILRICEFVLPAAMPGSIATAYWEVERWLTDQGLQTDLEWTTLVIVLFCLALPFISTLQDLPVKSQQRKRTSMPRSSSGGNVDLYHLEEMQSHEKQSGRSCSMQANCWSWTAEEISPAPFTLKSPSKQTSAASATDSLRHVSLAREFLQSPAGEQMIGPEGQFPIAIGQDRDLRRAALATIVVALQLLQQELKLGQVITTGSHIIEERFPIVLLQLSSWLGWHDWTASGPNHVLTTHDLVLPELETSVIDLLDVPPQPFAPQSIFGLIEDALHSRSAVYRTLVDLVSQSKDRTASHPLEVEAARLLPLTACILTLLHNNSSSPTRTHRNAPSLLRNSSRLTDLAYICTRPVTALGVSQSTSRALRKLEHGSSKGHPASRANHLALRDHRHIGDTALDAEGLPRWDVSSETDRQNITKMLYYQDRRFQEASRLVNQTRPPEIAFSPEPGWTEAEELEAQKQLAQHVARRTLSVASGRAIMHYNARTPLLTERVPIPAFSLQCIMRLRTESDNQQSLTVSADRTLFSEDKVCWAFFHNGASAGLMISKDAKWIDTSWILYNKPAELTNRHAGFLLALGLNGHLRSLAKWVAFKYLTPKHTMTSIGLLLGLAASYLGTSDTLITRLLSVHVTCLLPPGAAELNLSPLTQTTGMISIGLLYYNSQHRRMSEVMLSEVECKDGEDHTAEEAVIRDEGYRLAAGMALGLINLGQGSKLHALHDMRVFERLLTIAVGTKNVNLVHVLDRATAGAVIAIAFIFMKTNDPSIARKVDVPDTMHQFDYVRPDIFLLRSLARHLIMWDGIKPSSDYIQQSMPDHYRQQANLKTVKSLHTADLPCYYILAGICFAIALKFAGTQSMEARDVLVRYFDQFLHLSKMMAVNYDAKVTLGGIRNCLDLLALSVATVMAGSGDVVVMRRLRALHGRVDKDIPFGSHLASHMALGVLFLSGGTATFGTSTLAVASLVIAFYPLFPTDVLDNRSHLQALRHLWVLAVEPRCLVVRDVEDGHVIGNLAVEVVHKNGHVQNVRVPSLVPEYEDLKRIKIAADDYWPGDIDLDTRYEYGPTNKQSSRTTRDELTRQSRGINVFLRRRALYDKPDLNTFASDLEALDQMQGVPSVNPNAMTNEKWRPASNISKTGNALEWVFGLNVFEDLDYAERALVSDSSGRIESSTTPNDDQASFLLGTIVDTRLELEHGTIGPPNSSSSATGKMELMRQRKLDYDKLWQLRLLLAFADTVGRSEQQNGSDEVRMDNVMTSKVREGSDNKGQSLRLEFIERLRERLWSMNGQALNETT